MGQKPVVEEQKSPRRLEKKAAEKNKVSTKDPNKSLQHRI